MGIEKNPAGFSHQHNLDGTFDSICRKCFLTVARSIGESELIRFEELHICAGLSPDRAVLAYSS